MLKRFQNHHLNVSVKKSPNDRYCWLLCTDWEKLSQISLYNVLVSSINFLKVTIKWDLKYCNNFSECVFLIIRLWYSFRVLFKVWDCLKAFKSQWYFKLGSKTGFTNIIMTWKLLPKEKEILNGGKLDLTVQCCPHKTKRRFSKKNLFHRLNLGKTKLVVKRSP